MTRSPYDPDKSLTDAQRAAEPTLPRPGGADTEGTSRAGYKTHPRTRLFLRGPWEMGASVLIALGVVMLMQPFSMTLYTWSFFVILTGTVGFLIVSHFPEE